jgi:DeoR/GlpR family transcriptional regulator of sugar metabolism
MTAERKGRVLELLEREGSVVARALAESWGISEDTVRRDLRDLAADGKLQRVHGGALRLSPAAQDYVTRLRVATDEKVKVGNFAASMIRDGQTIFLDGGTTTQAMCRALPRDLRATVWTHSPTITTELLDRDGLEVHLIGGRVFPHSMVTLGSVAAEQISSITVDTFFMGVSGVHATAGLTTGDPEEAAIKRAISRRAGETYVLASSEKIGAASAYSVIPFLDVSAAITDATGPSATLREIEAAGLALITAS